MLKHGEINPLNVHGPRQLAHCPPHFEQVQFESHVADKTFTDWIYENLAGRFYIGTIDVNVNNRAIQRQTLIGFEIPGEASYFSLFLTQLNQPQSFW